MRCVVIMAGGRGERFWPKSRLAQPKQFLNLVGNKSMIQMTYERALEITDRENIFIVVSEELVPLVKEHIPDISYENLIVEPLPKNTAAAIGLASIKVRQILGNASMFVTPSDHYIDDLDKFYDAVEAGFISAEKYLSLVTLGIKPTRPETGYGYIEIGNLVDTFSGVNIFEVKRFVEKPDQKTAMSYLGTGKFFWNSGMFIWKTSVILEEISKHMPELCEALMEIEENLGTDDEKETIFREFNRLQSISIDYGVMEKSSSVLCVRSDFVWDDIGSWGAVYRLNEKDENGNFTKGNVVTFDVTNSLIWADNIGVVAVSSVENMVIVKEGDNVLVTKLDKDQTVRELIKIMKEKDKYKKYL